MEKKTKDAMKAEIERVLKRVMPPPPRLMRDEIAELAEQHGLNLFLRAFISQHFGCRSLGAVPQDGLEIVWRNLSDMISRFEKIRQREPKH